MYRFAQRNGWKHNSDHESLVAFIHYCFINFLWSFVRLENCSTSLCYFERSLWLPAPVTTCSVENKRHLTAILWQARFRRSRVAEAHPQTFFFFPSDEENGWREIMISRVPKLAVKIMLQSSWQAEQCLMESKWYYKRFCHTENTAGKTWRGSMAGWTSSDMLHCDSIRGSDTERRQIPRDIYTQFHCYNSDST